jgi:hypothetical protein
MAKKTLHRGRIQAQGGGTEKSVAWARQEPPTEDDMLEMCDRLERQLTARERKVRVRALLELRRFIQAAAHSGGVFAPVSKSFLARGSKDIRIDLEVIKGMACVPNEEGD